MDNIKDLNTDENPDKSTEKLILKAAKDVFHRKGLAGARMQEIADEAGLNKAMLHYYFRTKDKLFEAIFSEECCGFFDKLADLINVDLPLLEKIEHFVENYTELLLKNSYIPAFIISEMHHNPEKIKHMFIDRIFSVKYKFLGDITTAVSLGLIKPVDPRQLIVNIIALCIFPIAARPMLTLMLEFNDKEYLDFIETRKKEVAKFIINSIKIN
ncbi:MAG: TetR/AcrR family transcriptional regulator [Bacteroidetes bacterium]|nr:TetR/AcrR family transcriptional regulator [Bacteroidota bacterium]